jgi:hypothetical protein
VCILLQVNLAEAFTFDHDISLTVQYEDMYRPQVIIEKGVSDCGMYKHPSVYTTYGVSHTISSLDTTFILICVSVQSSI